MYVRRDRAYAWREDPQPLESFAPAPASRQATRTLWARVPWKGRLGLYVAVRLRRGQLEVAIAGAPPIKWVPAERALNEFEAERWAVIGFK